MVLCPELSYTHKFAHVFCFVQTDVLALNYCEKKLIGIIFSAVFNLQKIKRIIQRVLMYPLNPSTSNVLVKLKCLLGMDESIYK